MSKLLRSVACYAAQGAWGERSPRNTKNVNVEALKERSLLRDPRGPGRTLTKKYENVNVEALKERSLLRDPRGPGSTLPGGLK